MATVASIVMRAMVWMVIEMVLEDFVEVLMVTEVVNPMVITTVILVLPYLASVA